VLEAVRDHTTQQSEIVMGFAMGALFIAVGLFAITPMGAEIVARKNRRAGGGVQGYAPKSAPAARVTGLVLAALGVVFIVLTAA
jgi:hypothetical protein